MLFAGERNLLSENPAIMPSDQQLLSNWSVARSHPEFCSNYTALISELKWLIFHDSHLYEE
jgi:hypothetical protein